MFHYLDVSWFGMHPHNDLFYKRLAESAVRELGYGYEELHLHKLIRQNKYYVYIEYGSTKYLL